MEEGGGESEGREVRGVEVGEVGESYVTWVRLDRAGVQLCLGRGERYIGQCRFGEGWEG